MMHYKKFMDVILDHVVEHGDTTSFKNVTISPSKSLESLIRSLLSEVNQTNSRITFDNLVLANACAKEFPGQYSTLLAQYCYQLSNN